MNVTAMRCEGEVVEFSLGEDGPATRNDLFGVAERVWPRAQALVLRWPTGREEVYERRDGGWRALPG